MLGNKGDLMTTFARWIPLPENESAQLAVQRIAQNVGQSDKQREINPLFLHGPSGTGKSHLASALITEVTQLRPDAIALSLVAGDLHRSFQDEEDGKRSVILQDARNTDVLVVEDLQHVSEAAIPPLTNLIDYRLARQRQMVFTALHGPANLSQLPSRLTSRFAQGLVLGLSTLSPESRKTFLTQRAEQREIFIIDGILHWLAEHVGGSARELEGALSRLELLMEIEGPNIDVNAVAVAFQEDADLRKPTVDRIALRVSKYFKLSSKQLRDRSRAHHVLLPRQVSMYLARELTELSLKQIGDYFGGRDHSTVLHACRKVETALQKDVSLSGVVRQLQADLT